MRLILASNSPRRKDLLTESGFVFDVISADIDETPLSNEAPERFAVRMAKEKAEAVAKSSGSGSCVILAADTVVTIDGKILGKPQDADDAMRMLRSLSGRTHEVITGWCILVTEIGSPPAETSAFETTRVTFRPLTEAEVSSYVATREPMDKAGAYAIQGKAAEFTLEIDGLRSNVVGLPVERLVDILKKSLASPVN